MSLPNSMTVGRSYSDYVRCGYEDEETEDPCEGCEGFRTSDCCGADCDPDILICMQCREHCGTQCEECEDKQP